MPLTSPLSPVPAFQAYSGPRKVGTLDIEIPISELPHPPAPDPSISTIRFRIFYPCEAPSKPGKSVVYWIPEPQHQHVSAYASFLGASSRISHLIAYFPRLLYHIKIPAYENAKLLPCSTKTTRWPVMVFSHGLGGTRNLYSQLLGSLASHGIVVVAPDHRDGSAPISFIRSVESGKPQPVKYKPIPHTQSKEIEDARNDQLKIRLWELACTYEALLKIDRGTNITVLLTSNRRHRSEGQGDLTMFESLLDVHTPGSITWAGHSFGAATTIQFVKSVFYRPSKSMVSTDRCLYDAPDDSPIASQITPSSTICLLDLWAFPLKSPATRWLWDKPLPCYASDGPGGSNVLAVLSEGFFKWKGNLENTKQAISPSPADKDRGLTSSKSPPHIFYPVTSAHLSQSDFGLLFPWLIKVAFKAIEPERTLRLNVRAMLEVMRQNGVELADTSNIDMEIVEAPNHQLSPYAKANGSGSHSSSGDAQDDSNERKATFGGQDRKILSPDESIRGWIALSLDEQTTAQEGANQETADEASPSDAIVGGEVLGHKLVP